jgi:uncharacterized protein (TIGR03067 family)
MMRIVALLLFLAASFSFAGDDTKDAVKKTLKILQGEWKIEAGQKDGENVPDEVKQNMTIVFEGSKLFVRDAAGENKDEMSFTFDTKAKPAAIDFVRKRDNKKLEGIFELKGDVLKLCLYDGANNARPSEFSAPQGSNNTYAELKRVKK